MAELNEMRERKKLLPKHYKINENQRSSVEVKQRFLDGTFGNTIANDRSSDDLRKKPGKTLQESLALDEARSKYQRKTQYGKEVMEMYHPKISDQKQ